MARNELDTAPDDLGDIYDMVTIDNCRAEQSKDQQSIRYRKEVLEIQQAEDPYFGAKKYTTQVNGENRKIGRD